MFNLRLFCALFLAAASTCNAQSSNYNISGQIVRHPDNRPIPGAHITLTMVDHRDRHLSVISGDNGQFSFGNLPAAKYSLEASYHGWSQLLQQDEGFSTAVAVGPGLDSEHVLFVLDAPASIAGSVFDDDGEPVSAAQVTLFQQTISDGIFQTRMASGTQTKSTGSFRFGHLRSGTYYVAVSARPWYAQNRPPQINVANAQTTQEAAIPRIPDPPAELDVTYPLTYYAGATTPEGAAPLKLEEGMNSEIQITLHAVPALHISIETTEANGQIIIPSLQQPGPGGSLINYGYGLDAPPGNYILNSPSGMQPLSLTGDTTIRLNQSVKTSVMGKLLSDADFPVNMSIWLRNLASGESNFINIAHDGSFNLPQIHPGRYRMILANDPDMYMQKVSVKGGTYQQGELEIPQGAKIELTVTAVHGLTQIKGVAMKDNKPAAGAMVLLIPQDFSHGHWIPRDQSDSDGTFTLTAVIPGHFTLIAIDNGRGLAYDDPAVQAQYLPRGTAIVAPLSKEASVDVEVQPRQ